MTTSWEAETVNPLSLENDIPFVGGIDTGDDIEKSRLPGAIGSDQADDFVAIGAHVEGGERFESAEILGDGVDFEQHSTTPRRRLSVQGRDVVMGAVPVDGK